MFVSEGAELMSVRLDSQATAQTGRKETLPDQTLRELSLSVAILAINLGTAGIASTRRRNA
jgi:hypothetical protein